MQFHEKDTVTKWLKGKFRQAVREYFDSEIKELWKDFVGDIPELAGDGGPEDFLPDADYASKVAAKKFEIEKVLAFKPIAEDFLNQQEDEIEAYVQERVDYLKGLLTDNVGNSVGMARADVVLSLAGEINGSENDPPPLLIALYMVKHGNRVRG